MKDLVNDAFVFALEAHKDQTRKDGKPYISHPFSVAMELARNGAGDELIAAGLLHDTIEDAGIDPEKIRDRFGAEVLEIIQFDTENKRLSWEERKTKTLEELKNCDRKYAMLVCADKLANINDIAEDIEKNGESIWECFKFPKDVQEKLYRRYCVVFEQISELKMYDDLKRTVDIVFDR